MGFELAAGEHFTIWDGTGEAVEKLPAGVYFCDLKTNTSRAFRKMLLL